MSRARWLFVVLGVSYALALAALVFLPLKPDPVWNFLWERFRIEYTPARDDVLDIAGNVVLFVPVGVFARYGWRALGASRPAVAALITGAAVGGGIEIVQWMLGWRTASVQDALCNTMGAVIGSALAGLLGRHHTAPGGQTSPAVDPESHPDS